MAENVLVRPWPQEDRGLAPPPTDPTAEVVVSTADAAALSPLVPTACTADAALAPSMPIACMTMATKRATKLIEIREHSPIPIDCATMRHELLRGAIKCIGGHFRRIWEYLWTSFPTLNLDYDNTKRSGIQARLLMNEIKRLLVLFIAVQIRVAGFLPPSSSDPNGRANTSAKNG